MTQAMSHIFRGLSLAALLMAGSCAAPTNDANGMFEDGAVNNPIRVEPSYQALKLSYSPAGLSTDDATRFGAFVDDYRVHGNGSIMISAPADMNANAAITDLSDRINQMGVSRDRIIVTTHDAPRGDIVIELNYISYAASTNRCGSWTEVLSKTLDNSTPKNFGCAVQQNIAAMVADPRDLLGPRPMDDADARRRQTVITKYDLGQPTPADKTSDQSGAVSDVNKQ